MLNKFIGRIFNKCSIQFKRQCSLPAIMNRSKYLCQSARFGNFAHLRKHYPNTRHPNERGRMNGYV